MRKNKYTAFDQCKTIKEWVDSDICKKNGITYNRLYCRIVKLGWKTKDAVTKKPAARDGKKIFKAFGEKKTINEWSKSQVCKNAGLLYWDLFNRIITLGWPVEIALTTKIGHAPHGKYTGSSKA